MNMFILLFSDVISLDIEKVTSLKFQFAGHHHLVARGLHDVVDPAPNVLAILGRLIGVEA